MSADIHSLIGAYALDAVTDGERISFEEHLRRCAACRHELAELREACCRLSSIIAVAPPPALRPRILAGIGAIRPLPPLVGQDQAIDQLGAIDRPGTRAATTARRTPVRRWLTTAVAAAAVVVGGLTWQPWRDGAPAPISATQQVLQAPDSERRAAHLAGGTVVSVVYSPGLDQAVVSTQHLPPAPAGHIYQLWYMTGSGTATSAGTVTPSASGRATVLLTGAAPSGAVVGITVEPEGGSPRPTTHPIATVRLAD